MKLTLKAKGLLVAGLTAFIMGCGGSDNDTIVPPIGDTQPIAPFAVYTMTNALSGNAIVELRRAANGTLQNVGTYPTGGLGSGDGLNGSTNALFFSPEVNRFYAVNGGNNTVSALVLGTDGTIAQLSTVNSGGVNPISVTAYIDVMYVLNAGDINTPANISGYRLVGNQLQGIPGSTRQLSAANPNPAQIEFSPNGNVLVVTERDTNRITSFTMTDGVAGQPQPQASAGNTPFGFDFTPAGTLLVSEANVVGGAPVANGSSVSSYSIGVNGALLDISTAIADNQTAACWVEVSPTAPFAYVTNTASDNISIYSISANGSLVLQGNGNNAATGDAPVDLAISADSLYLYALNRGDDTLSAYRINADGTLTAINGLAGLPDSAAGLVAR